MTDIKIKWRVAPVPTGRYRAFDSRGWPSAELEDGTFIAGISCKSEYRPANVKTGKHAPLKLRIADRSKGPQWTAVYSKNEYTTLPEAKAALLKILEAHPELLGER